MMTGFIYSFYGLCWAGCLVLLVYLYKRRQKIKHLEDFEERDN